MTEFDKWLDQLGILGLDCTEVECARKAWEAATERAIKVVKSKKPFNVPYLYNREFNRGFERAQGDIIQALKKESDG